MNLGKYIRNAAITTAATAAILGSAACGHGADAQKNAADNSVHKPYVQNHINPEAPATYVFNEIDGNCSLRRVPMEFPFLGNQYYDHDRVVRIIASEYSVQNSGGFEINVFRKTYGTGYQISPDLVLTVDHAVDTGESIEVRYAGNISVKARVVAADIYNDLALLELERPRFFDDTVQFRTIVDPYQTAEIRAIDSSDAWYLYRSSRNNIPIQIGETDHLQVKDGMDGSLSRLLYKSESPTIPGMSGSAIVDEGNRIIGTLSVIVITSSETLSKSPLPQEIVRFLDEYCNGN